MPLLIRIILQRVAGVLVTALAFLGLTPEVTIPTEQEIQVRIEEQREIVEDILTETVNVITSDIEIEILPVIPSVTDFLESSPLLISPNVETEFTNLSDVVVNIICTQQNGHITTASTGSGVLISPKGIVLTNAHVAQFFLLEDYYGYFKMSCGIYRENIPTFGYRADLLYISEEWVEDNYQLIQEETPRGTGEKDYALLAITANTNITLDLPDTFSYTNIATNQSFYAVDDIIRVAGFPEAPASIFELTRAGSLQNDTTEITKVYTFKDSLIDIFTTGETKVANRGASGGGIFKNRTLIGITVTTTPGEILNKINALTTDYIDRDIKNDTGKSITSMISGDIYKNVADFQESTLPRLAKLLNSAF